MKAINGGYKSMIYKILFAYTDPASGQNYIFKGIKEGSDPAEANYYFKKQYPRHNIEILETTPIN